MGKCECNGSTETIVTMFRKLQSCLPEVTRASCKTARGDGLTGVGIVPVLGQYRCWDFTGKRYEPERYEERRIQSEKL